MGSVDQNLSFSEHGHVAYQIKDNHKCSNMLANILPADPYSLALGMGSVDQNSSSEHGHVAYQIKDNHKCSNMLANILPADPHSLALGMGSVDQNLTFSEHGHVVYLCFYFFFLNLTFFFLCMLHIKLKKNHECSNMVANSLPADPHTPTPFPWGWGQ